MSCGFPTPSRRDAMGEDQFTVRTTLLQLTAAGQAVIGANPRRVYLGLSPAVAIGQTSFAPVGAGPDVAPWNCAGGDNVEWSYRTHGPLPALAWICTGGSFPSFVTIIEVISLR